MRYIAASVYICPLVSAGVAAQHGVSAWLETSESSELEGRVIEHRWPSPQCIAAD